VNRARLASAVLAFGFTAGIPLAALAQQDAVPKPIPHPTPMTVVQGFGTAVVSRASDHKDKHGGSVAPFTSVTLDHIFSAGWKTGPKVGTEITVIPLGVAIAPIALKITKAEYGSDRCDDNLPWLWDLEVEPVTQPAFREAQALSGRHPEYPFDVAVIYPANPSARAVGRSHLTRAMLPKGVPLRIVHAVIDLDGDGAPELLKTEFCCEKPSAPAQSGRCNYTCSEIYERVGRVWRLRDSQAPC
jgi:hypothetical protein